MFQWNPEAFGANTAKLLQFTQPIEPGIQPASQEMHARFSKLDPQTLAAANPIVDMEMARCCIAGIWLLHGFLDESHRISQTLASSSGSYWHGIMHRCEPDYSNAKYWFGRVGDHPIYATLGTAAQQVAAASRDLDQTTYLVSQTYWDPIRFIDLYAAESDCTGPDRQCAQAVGLLEWRMLFAYCYHNAIRRTT